MNIEQTLRTLGSALMLSLHFTATQAQMTSPNFVTHSDYQTTKECVQKAFTKHVGSDVPKEQREIDEEGNSYVFFETILTNKDQPEGYRKLSVTIFEHKYNPEVINILGIEASSGDTMAPPDNSVSGHTNTSFSNILYFQGIAQRFSHAYGKPRHDMRQVANNVDRDLRECLMIARVPSRITRARFG
jgi:hypothetical protein